MSPTCRLMLGRSPCWPWRRGCGSCSCEASWACGLACRPDAARKLIEVRDVALIDRDVATGQDRLLGRISGRRLAFDERDHLTQLGGGGARDRARVLIS